MFFAVGNDIEENRRFEKLCHEDSSFFKRVYTQTEQEYIMSKRDRAKAAAGLFCVKEAASKALGRGLYGLIPREIETYRDEGGAPLLRLLGSAASQYEGFRFSVSISHTKDITSAVCIVFKE